VTLEQYRTTYPSGNGRTADIAYQLGDIHEEAGDASKAIEEFKRALDAKPPVSLELELRYRIGVCKEQLGETDEAIRSYEKAMKASKKTDPFRLLAVVRCAALYEEQEAWKKAIGAYKDLISNSQDKELVLAANERVTQLESIAR
jgi:tetratricopeptide (TPR) repeat protein